MVKKIAGMDKYIMKVFEPFRHLIKNWPSFIDSVEFLIDNFLTENITADIEGITDKESYTVFGNQTGYGWDSPPEYEEYETWVPGGVKIVATASMKYPDLVREWIKELRSDLTDPREFQKTFLLKLSKDSGFEMGLERLFKAVLFSSVKDLDENFWFDIADVKSNIGEYMDETPTSVDVGDGVNSKLEEVSLDRSGIYVRIKAVIDINVEIEWESHMRRRASKWEKLPKGWTDKSADKFWNSLTGDRKHKVTACIAKMTGKIDDPGAFCASLADKVDPGWRKEVNRKKKATMVPRVLEDVLKPLVVPPDKPDRFLKSEKLWKKFLTGFMETLNELPWLMTNDVKWGGRNVAEVEELPTRGKDPFVKVSITWNPWLEENAFVKQFLKSVISLLNPQGVRDLLKILTIELQKPTQFRRVFDKIVDPIFEGFAGELASDFQYESSPYEDLLDEYKPSSPESIDVEDMDFNTVSKGIGAMTEYTIKYYILETPEEEFYERPGRDPDQWRDERIDQEDWRTMSASKLARQWMLKQAASAFEPFMEPVKRIPPMAFLEILKVQHDDEFGDKQPFAKPYICGFIVMMFRNLNLHQIEKKLYNLYERGGPGVYYGDGRNSVKSLAHNYASWIRKAGGPVAAATIAIELLKKSRQPQMAAKTEALLVGELSDAIAEASVPKGKLETDAQVLKRLVEKEMPSARGLLLEAKKDPKTLRAYVSDILEDANWHNLAEKLWVDPNVELNQDVISDISRDHSWNVVDLAIHGIAALSLVNDWVGISIIKNAIKKQFPDWLTENTQVI